MSLRSRVLLAFKNLHRTRLDVFKGDSRAQDAGRIKINEEFRKNIGESEEGKIKELLQIAEDSCMILRKHVIQIEQIGDNKFRANVTKDTYKLDNKLYSNVTEKELLEASRKKKKSKSPPASQE